MLRGDEVGALLAQHLIRRDPGLTGTFATSIVSSSLLGKIAAAHGLGFEETLTGFKWISRVSGLRFGYEEALGYCVDPAGVRVGVVVHVVRLAVELVVRVLRLGQLVVGQVVFVVVVRRVVGQQLVVVGHEPRRVRHQPLGQR